MSEPTIIASRSGPVQTLTLNRPQALNSFTAEMHGLLRSELDAAAAEPAVRCVVITGAGRGFCAGQDLADPAVAPAAEGAAPDVGAAIERFYKPLALRLRSMPVPVLAAVNGVAAGAGANAAFCCDVVVAARSAGFIQAFAKIGLVPDCGGTWLLPRLVGRGKAMALAMLGEKVSADEAAALGLIHRSIADDAFAGEVAALAARLAALPTRALVATRAALDAAQAMSFEAALGNEAVVQRELGHAADFREGVAAFKAKRAAVFSDR